jgi:7-cyano-7-deazaguanine synthase in queuosine biosynthesis
VYKAAVVLDDTHSEPDCLHLHPGINMRTGDQYFEDVFGETTSLERDLLTVASAIYACDLAFKRGEREKFTRKIEVKIPVVNLATFRHVIEELEYILHFLSNDAWQITFVQDPNGTPEEVRDWPQHDNGKVLLFSGGLDSFAAAVMYGDMNSNCQLVSHVTANQVVSQCQVTLNTYLNTKYPEHFDRDVIRIGCRSNIKRGFPFPSDGDREETQRTRSFLFLTLAALVARRRGFVNVIYIAANGQMAIHLPLTAARIGAFSTHTAHPEFVEVMSRLLETIFNFPLRIENPFLYMTKSEVIAEVVKTHEDILEETVSCWKASRIAGQLKHCGICIPCLIRRIAIEANGVTIKEYNRDIFRENVGMLPATDDGKRNLMELAEFVRYFEVLPTPAKIQVVYPELVSVYIDTAQAIEMYHRFAVEARLVFNRYPQLQTVLK